MHFYDILSITNNHDVINFGRA